MNYAKQLVGKLSFSHFRLKFANCYRQLKATLFCKKLLFNKVGKMNVSNTTSMSNISNEVNYVGFGVLAIVANVIVIFVLLRNITFLKKSAFIFGLAVADLINGLALFITGIKRIQYVYTETSKMSVHPFTCLQSVTSLWLIGVQLPTAVMALIGAERLIAVAFFMWYYKKWTNVLAWCLTGMVYVLCAFSLTTIWSITYNLPDRTKTSVNCITPSVVGPVYSSYNYGLAIVNGTVAILASATALILFLSKKNKLQTGEGFQIRRHVKKQWQLTTSMTCIAVVDFCCVVIPNVFLLLISTFSVRFPPSFGNVGNWSSSVFCARSASTVIIYIILNREFRNALYKAYGYRTVSVQPMGANTSNSQR